MATLQRAGPSHAIVHLGNQEESECKVEVHMSREAARKLVAENWEALLEGKDDERFEIKLGGAMLTKLMRA